MGKAIVMEQVFEMALAKIPPQLRERPETRFTVIINGQKKPDGRNWQDNGANYSITDPPLAGYLSQGHNYGVLCGLGGITVPDLDDIPRLKELGVLQKIPNTFQDRTGRGGLHVWFDCPELDHKIGLYDPELKDEDGDPLHLGEIQSKGQQVVGPNSTHPNGKKYQIVNDAPIMKISKADLLKIFDGLILTGLEDPAEEPKRAEARRRKAGGSSLGDNIPIDAVAWPKDIVKHSGSEVIGTHPLHGSKTGKNFSVNTAKNCWHCFRCGPPGEHRGGGGPLEWLAVEAGLIFCKDAKKGCLDDRETFKQVLQIAKDRGFYIPDRNQEQAISEEELLKIKIPENPRFNTNLESNNFIQEYIRYGETVSDGYIDYWFAGGLFCLSVAVNRNVVIKLRQGSIYTNVWINELGLSSLARKSTTIDKTDLTIAAANIDPDCKMPDEFSPEAMIERLDQRPKAYMIKDESADCWWS